MLAAVVPPAAAHRLDEYLQATLLTVEKDIIKADLYLTPGVAVLPAVLADLDADGDGEFSATEQRAYAWRVLGDISFTLNGAHLTPRLVASAFPKLTDLKEGVGDIHLEIALDLPRAGIERTLRVENRHHRAIAAYQVNCLAPRDPAVRLTAPRRDETQSVYEVDYRQSK